MLKSFLNRYPQIQVLPETEIATPYHHEIRFRVQDNEWWIRCLQRLTKAFPNVCFSRRYVTNQTFGYQWSLILFGPREEDQLEEFCRDCDTVISDLSAVISHAPEAELKSANDRVHVVSERILKDEEGKIVGEVRKIQLNCEEKKMNSYDDNRAPRIFSGSYEDMSRQIANSIGTLRRR